MNYKVLVNKSHPMKPHQITGKHLMIVKDIENQDVLIERTTYQSYVALHKFLMKQNMEIGLDSGYRSLARQQQLKEEFIEEYGEEYASKIVAPEGTSEHHTGLAIDLSIKDDDNAWLTDNDTVIKHVSTFERMHPYLSRFGFILRYPKEKEHITGYPYEPWHIRYVGKKLANYLEKHHKTLEEYYEEKRK